MNTDGLIDLLSDNLEPVSHGRFARTLVLVVLLGGATAFGVMLATVGPRPYLISTVHLEWCVIKLLFALTVVIAATPSLLRSSRPAQDSITPCAPVLMPFVAVTAVAAGALLSSPELWREMLFGATTVSPARCLLCIVAFGAIPLVALFYTLRQGAPTRPRVCGALAGIVAAALGAAAYALACSSDSVLFIAAWYGAAIALYAVLGALLAPRLLRW